MPKRTSSNKKRQSVDDEGDGDDGDDGFRDGDNEEDGEEDQPTSSSSSGMGRISLSGVIGMITGGFSNAVRSGLGFGFDSRDFEVEGLDITAQIDAIDAAHAAAQQTFSSSSSSSSSSHQGLQASGVALDHSRAEINAIEAVNFATEIDAIEAVHATVQQSSSSSSQGPNHAIVLALDRSPDEIREKFKFMIYAIDGEHNQLKCTIEDLIPRCNRKDFHIIYIKWGGSCSMSQSPNDKGKGLHLVIHYGYGNPSFKFDKEFPEPPGEQWSQLRKIVSDLMLAADFKTLWKAMKSAPKILSKALTLSNLESAWDATGAITLEGRVEVKAGNKLDPSDPQKILSFNPHFARDLDG